MLALLKDSNIQPTLKFLEVASRILKYPQHKITEEAADILNKGASTLLVSPS